MHTSNPNLDSSQEEPIYVYFDYNGTKVSELLIPSETKTLSDLITENSNKYKIPTDRFWELVNRNKINLSENNTNHSLDKNTKTSKNDNFSDKNEKMNSFSTRSNLSRTHKSRCTPLPGQEGNYSQRKKENLYKEILSYEKEEIPKQKLFELTANLLSSTNKYLQEHKNHELVDNSKNILNYINSGNMDQDLIKNDLINLCSERGKNVKFINSSAVNSKIQNVENAPKSPKFNFIKTDTYNKILNNTKARNLKSYAEREEFKQLNQKTTNFNSTKNPHNNFTYEYGSNYNNFNTDANILKENLKIFETENKIEDCKNYVEDINYKVVKKEEKIYNSNTFHNLNEKIQNNSMNVKNKVETNQNKIKANNLKNSNSSNFNLYKESNRNCNFEIDEKVLSSENMSEKSSFLYNKNSLNLDLLITNKKNNNTNRNQNNNNFINNISQNQVNNITSFKTLMRGPKGIKKMLNNQLSQSASKLDKSVSYGERLFYKGIVLGDKKEKKTELYKKQKQEEFDKNCTFKPKLNLNSLGMNLRSNLTKLLNPETPNNFSTPNIFNSGEFENYENKSRKIVSSKSANNIKNYNLIRNDTNTNLSVNSKINKTCYRTEQEIDILSKRLYDNAQRYRNKKQMLRDNYYDHLCTFSPQIFSRDDGEIPSMENFFNRLQSWVDKRNEKYEIDLEKSHFDEKTGRRLFSPQINKSKKHNEFALNQTSRERFQELYEIYKKRQNKIDEKKEKNAQELSFIANVAHINEKSKDIVEEIHTKIFIHLFEILADKTSKIIDGKVIDMSEIPEKIQNILMPLLNELKEQNETLTLDEFIMASKHLYVSLPIQFKQNLMEWYLSFNKIKKNMSIQECFNFPFKPEICDKSRQIADRSKLFCANMYLKSIESIKLHDESSERNNDFDAFKTKKNLSFYNNKNDKKKTSANEAIRKNLHRNYYDNDEKINETLAENNSEF